MTDELSDALANIDINGPSVIDIPFRTVPPPRVPSESELSEKLKDLNLSTRADKTSSVKGDENARPSRPSSLSSSDELETDTEKSESLVTFAYHQTYKPGTSSLQRKVKTISSKIEEDKTIATDESPAVKSTAVEIEALHAIPKFIDADQTWIDYEADKPSWRDIDKGKAPVPRTPLMRPFDTGSNKTTVEKGSGNMEMDFSPLEAHARGNNVTAPDPGENSPGVSRPNIQTEVDLQLKIEAAERRLGIAAETSNSQYDDDGEESESSIEFILDNESPEKTMSTIGNGYLERRRPRDEMHWTDEYWSSRTNGRGRGRGYYNRKSNESLSAPRNGGRVAGPNYASANASNFTLGDTSAYQDFNASTESLGWPKLGGEAGIAGNGKEKAKQMPSKSVRKNKDGTIFVPKSHRGHGPNRKREASSSLEDPDPSKKIKTPAKSAKKSPKPYKPQVKVDPNSASGLPEDEVDYGNTTESDRSSDVHLEDQSAREATMSPALPSPYIPSGSKKSKPLNPMAPPMFPASMQNKEPSGSNMSSSPQPVRNSQSKDISFGLSEAMKNPVQRILRENFLRRQREQSGAPSWANIAASSSPPTPRAEESSYDKRTGFGATTETKPLDASALANVGAKMIKRPGASAAAPAVPANLPAPATPVSEFNEFTMPAFATNPDPWDAWGGPGGSTTIGGFPEQAKKKGKRKTGKVGVVTVSDDVLSSMPRGDMKVPGATYVSTDDEGDGVANNDDDGFTTVARNSGGVRRGESRGRGRGRGGRGAGRAGSRPASRQRGGFGSPDGFGGGRGMADVRGRGGARTPRGHGRPLPGSDGSPQTGPAPLDTWP